MRLPLSALSVLCLLSSTGCVTLPGQGKPLFGTTQESEGSSEVKNAVIDKDSEKDVYTLPDISPGVRPATYTDEAGLWMTVDRAKNRLKTSGNLIRDPKINSYVRALVCKLAGPYCKDIRTYVVRVPAFNASMMPNGVMQAWTGLFLRVRNEAQLSAVLGHEIGHYLRRHSLQRMRETLSASNFLIFVQMAAAYAGVPSAGNLASLLAQGSLASFSRDNERESDFYGHRFLVQNGYDPREASVVWDQIIREDEASDEFQFRSLFMASHPQSEERSETLIRMANKAIEKGHKGEKGRKRFLDVFLPHRKSFLLDDLRRRQYSKTLELLKMLEEDGEKPAEIMYFRGEVYRLRNKEKDKEKALEAYKNALEAGTPPPEIHRYMGMIYSKLKQRVKMRTSYQRYLKLKPDASDAKMIKYLVETTKRAGL